MAWFFSYASGNSVLNAFAGPVIKTAFSNGSRCWDSEPAPKFGEGTGAVESASSSTTGPVNVGTLISRIKVSVLIGATLIGVSNDDTTKGGLTSGLSPESLFVVFAAPGVGPDGTEDPDAGVFPVV